MAEFINPIGKIRGKFGNVIPYVGKNGKNYCRSTSLKRKAGGEGQKRQSVAFGTTTSRKRWLTPVIRLGFPGGNGYPQGFCGFTSANVTHAITVEKIDPEVPVNRQKRATQEFQGTIDTGNYGLLQVNWLFQWSTRKLMLKTGKFLSPLPESNSSQWIASWTIASMPISFTIINTAALSKNWVNEVKR